MPLVVAAAITSLSPTMATTAERRGSSSSRIGRPKWPRLLPSAPGSRVWVCYTTVRGTLTLVITITVIDAIAVLVVSAFDVARVRS